MKDPNDWTKEDLYQHLQWAAEVEFWTVPLYLTALYSIKGLDQNYQEDYPAAAKVVESIVIEEMLHLELVCNLANALSYTPGFAPPNYQPGGQIPFIHPAQVPPELQGYEVKAGPLDQDQLKLFCVIELPLPKGDHDWANKDEYDSIGEMYDALTLGVTKLWDACFVGAEKNQRQKFQFKDFTGFKQQATDLDSALQAIQTIVAEGEGADATGDVPGTDQPGADPTYDPDQIEKVLSHYQKFHALLNADLPRSTRRSPSPTAQRPRQR